MREDQMSHCQFQCQIDNMHVLTGSQQDDRGGLIGISTFALVQGSACTFKIVLNKLLHSLYMHYNFIIQKFDIGAKAYTFHIILLMVTLGLLCCPFSLPCLFIAYMAATPYVSYSYTEVKKNLANLSLKAKIQNLIG